MLCSSVLHTERRRECGRSCCGKSPPWSVPSGICGSGEESVESGAYIIDVRPEAMYEKGHLKNAVNIPIAQLRQRLDEIPKTNRFMFTAVLDRPAIMRLWLCKEMVLPIFTTYRAVFLESVIMNILMI